MKNDKILRTYTRPKLKGKTGIHKEVREQGSHFYHSQVLTNLIFHFEERGVEGQELNPRLTQGGEYIGNP